MSRAERLRRRITAKRTRRGNRHRQWCKKHPHVLAFAFKGTKTASLYRDSRDGRTGGEHLRQVAPEATP